EEKAIREIGVLQKDGKLVALIVPAAKHGEQNVGQAIREVIERVSRRLPPYQRVSEYALTGEAIQRTRLGKVRRHLLSERYEKAKKGEEVSHERGAGPMSIEEMVGRRPCAARRLCRASDLGIARPALQRQTANTR